MNVHARLMAAAVGAMMAAGAVLPIETQAAPVKRVTTTTTTTGTTTTGTTTTGGSGCQGGPGGGPGGPGGSGGGPASGGLLITGTITAVSTTADTITVTPTNSSTSVTVAVTSNTKLVGHQAVSASAISLGDSLLITGLPTSVLASSITDDMTGSSSSSSSSSSSGSSSSGSTANNTPPMMPVPAVVMAISPALVVEVNGEYSVTITTNSDTTVAELLPITLSELAAGDTVSIQAMRSSSGTLTAVRVDAAAS